MSDTINIAEFNTKDWQAKDMSLLSRMVHKETKVEMFNKDFEILIMAKHQSEKDLEMLLGFIEKCPLPNLSKWEAQKFINEKYSKTRYCVMPPTLKTETA